MLEWFEEMLSQGYTIDLDADNKTIVGHFPMEPAAHAPFTLSDLIEAMK